MRRWHLVDGWGACYGTGTQEAHFRHFWAVFGIVDKIEELRGVVLEFRPYLTRQVLEHGARLGDDQHGLLVVRSLAEILVARLVPGHEVQDTGFEVAAHDDVDVALVLEGLLGDRRAAVVERSS